MHLNREHTMHHAKLSKSDRLKRVADLLKKPGYRRYSTLDIIKLCGVCAVSAVISELRANGMRIKCWREGSVWYYRRTS